MTEKQKRFAAVYLESGDEQRAFLSAGYRPPWTPQRVLTSGPVQSWLQEMQEEAGDEVMADRTEIAAFFSEVMRGSTDATNQQLKAAEFLAKNYDSLVSGDAGGNISDIPTFIDADEL